MTNFSVLPLQNIVNRLDEGLIRYQQNINDLQIRDGLIQRFEFTYEISHKILKRYLEYISPNPEIYDQMNFQDLIRSANEYGLLMGNWTDWKQYRDMRSRTSHTYDEETAIMVVSGIPKFLLEVKHLVKVLQERL
ncbi:nucleotidyltransferase substrate binding protein (TIGR01987 family) [Bisgaardia hudsonensis]|uniref:Nucleotidyltransferase substrate binding protein (TIGR01987 family) n=1 Tax=Bisgaardia hudsonensis TaxID=109472 RepID=A0A4R2MXM6_9PAST|nr:nucleotidyltransferase substrate binding protein [Bisgaardia hudsonensis]QLB13709.1 nucleotidyltransferase [Bisgaardia hudsonensis]TCP12046.1 nucleotidyltransferase substrate binding protein (TIGR01987 family) [Bisgaardia hudsonensis]